MSDQGGRRAREQSSRGRLWTHLVGYLGWGLLSIGATVLQNAPDLLDWLPTEAIWGLVVVGALAQLPFVARDVLQRSDPGEVPDSFWSEGRGDNLILPEQNFVGYAAQRRRLNHLFARFARTGVRGALDGLRWWRLPGPQMPPLAVVVTGAPGTGKSQLANLVARESADRFPDGVRWVDLATGTAADEDAGPEDAPEGGPANGSGDGPGGAAPAAGGPGGRGPEAAPANGSPGPGAAVPAQRGPDGAAVPGEPDAAAAAEAQPAAGAAPQGRPFPWLRMPDVFPRRLRRLAANGGAEEGADPAEEAPAPSAPRLRSVQALLEELLGASGDTPRGPRRHLEEAWRGRTAGRRLLLVLENAEDPAQVEPLLPNSPGSAVLITARRPFHGAGFDSTEVHLTGLTTDEGVDLLNRIAGEPAAGDAGSAERSARQAIAAHCGGLPLALQMCGRRLASRAGEDAQELLGKLQGDHAEPLLDPTGFPASFLSVFRLCGDDARRLLHRMAASGLREVTDSAAAALLDAELHRAGAVLQELIDLSLLERLGQADDGLQRYRMHRLVLETMVVLQPADLGIAPEEARAEWSGPARAAAARRLVAAYAWLAQQAAAELHPGDSGFPDPPLSGDDPEPMAARLGLVAPERPQEWLHREREVLLGCVWLAADSGCPGEAWRLARAVTDMCQVLRTHWEEWDQAVEAQLALAYGAADAQALGMALLDASELSGARGQYRPGAAYAHKARLAFSELGSDERWEARALRAQGVCEQRWGDLTEAREHLEYAEQALQRAGERWWRARALGNLAELHADLGHSDRAAALYGEAAAVFTSEGDAQQADLMAVMLAEVFADKGCDLRAWIMLEPLLDQFRDQRRLWYAAQCLRVLGGLNGERLRFQADEVASLLQRLNRVELRTQADEHAARTRPLPPVERRRAEERVAERERLSAELAERLGGEAGADAVRAAFASRSTRAGLREARRSWTPARRVARLEAAVRMMHRMGDEWGVARTQVTLGRVLVRERDFDAAETAFFAGAGAFERLSDAGQRTGERGDKRWEARTHHAAAEEVLAAVATRDGGPEATVQRRFARPVRLGLAHARRAEELYAERGNHRGRVAVLILTARLMWVDGADRGFVLSRLDAAAAEAARHSLRELHATATALRVRFATDHPDIARIWQIH